MGDVDVLEHCLSGSQKLIDTTDALGCTAAVNAAMNQRVETIKFLHKAGADLEKPCDSGSTPLMYAARTGNLDTVAYLVSQGISISQSNSTDSALTWAAKHGHINIVRFLHAADVGVGDAMWTGNQLMWAGAHGQEQQMRIMLARGDHDVHEQDIRGNTALLWAARSGNVNGVQILINNGADVNDHSHNHWTAAMQAAYYGNLEALKVLYKAGSDLNVRDAAEWNAVMWAACRGHVDVLAWLLAAGADHGKNVFGWTPLMVAAASDQYAALQFLLRKNSDWKAVNCEGETAEDIARKFDSKEIVSVLKGIRETYEYEKVRQGNRDEL